jgi:protein O-mannosyl-transferase
VRGLADHLRRDPGLALLVAALAAAAALYAPTLGYGLVNYDDHWLVRDNWILQDASWESIKIVWFDLASPRRFVLTPEYLPVRDMSILLDFAVWGDWYPGFHLTNLLVYLLSISVWFLALTAFGVDRRVAGLCVLLWALHPSHAESVAWITERKGLLSVMFAGAAALGFARFRAGASTRWLACAAVAAVCAVWSKAPGAFAVAALAGLELALPARRTSWRRSLAGLGVIGVATVAAFVPVVMLAMDASVVGSEAKGPAGRLAMVVGVHGFYLREAAMTVRNAVSYPLSTAGPGVLDLALGAIGLVVMLGLVLAPRRSRLGAAPELGAGALIWLIGWLPVSHLVLPLQMVYVADRYLLFPTLGFALIAAAAIVRIPRPRARAALVAVIAVSASLRTLDAQGSWRDSRALWQRAVASHPADGNAWAMYVEAVIADEGRGDPELVDAIVAEGLRHGRAPRLLHRQALVLLARDRARAVEVMREAAAGGEAIAMSNLALLLLEDGLDDGARDEALTWARRGAAARPNAHAHRTLGKVALAAGQAAEALAAFERACALEPHGCANRLNLGLALAALGRSAEAIPHFAACEHDPVHGPRARHELARVRGAAP